MTLPVNEITIKVDREQLEKLLEFFFIYIQCQFGTLAEFAKLYPDIAKLLIVFSQQLKRES